MEAHPRESPIEINPNPSPSSSSPNSATSSSTHSSTHSLPTPATPKPTTPRPPPADPTTTHNHPFPTTFIQADTSSFKQVVQLLTGSTETQAKCSATPPKPTPNSKPAAAPTPGGPKKPAFKLYERRSSLKGLKTISPLLPGRGPATSASFSPRKLQPSEILSPSILDMPSLVLSPVTPLIPDPFNRPSPGSAHLVQSAEDRAIAEKGFYLHPSPRLAGPGEAPPPRLLPLFPVTSPRAAAGSSLASP